MNRITYWLTNISFLLVLTGFIGHEVTPHHHHAFAEESHSCCHSNPNKDNDGTSNNPPCTILTNYHNNTKRIEISNYQAKPLHDHTNFINAIISHTAQCCILYFEKFKSLILFTPPRAKDLYLTQSVYRRGPPVA
jgi:hypothetical protein